MARFEVLPFPETVVKEGENCARNKFIDNNEESNSSKFCLVFS